MQKRSLIHKFFWVFLGFLTFLSPALAAVENVPEQQEHFYLDKTQLVVQQIGSLKKRFTQASQELEYLQRQQKEGFVSLLNEQANNFLLHKTHLLLASIKTSLEGINIELTDSQQTVMWLEKNIQEIENQLNALNIFGIRLVREDPVQAQSLRSERQYQQNLYQYEKERMHYLVALQKSETTIFQLYRERYFRINAFLKSRKMLQIKERQVKSELEFQKQQAYWLQRLDALYGQLQVKASREQYLHLENEVFYVNENINLIYLKTLLRRYQDQIWQMRLSLSRTSSISALNALSDQAQGLGRQALRVNALLDDRIEIIKKRTAIYQNENQNKTVDHELAAKVGMPAKVPLLSPEKSDLAEKLIDLQGNFQDLHKDVGLLNKRSLDLRNSLDKAIQHELSARQGLPGFSAEAWLDLGKEAVLLPTLSFKLVKGFVGSVVKALQKINLVQGLLLLAVEALVIVIFSFTQRFMFKSLARTVEQGNLFANIKYLLVSFFVRNRLPLAIIINSWILFYFLAIPERQYNWLLELAAVWLIFRIIGILARIGLIETVHDSKGYDVKLYRSLRAIFAFGALITSITVFLHQLPLIYEMIDFFDRLFLLLLLTVSILILRYWRVVPELIMPYIDPRRTYLRRIIYFMGIFTPSLLFVNSLVGVFGFVNLVWMIVWYEGIFTIVLVAYFLLRGLLNEGMGAISNLMISYVSNGWLWTEAFLKPVHSILKLFLFFGAWMLLFVFYGWDQQSPVVERLNKLMLYPLAQVLNTTITAVSICKLIFAVSLFYWAARWTREFVFRLLLSRTQDLGIRNSMAILSQYTVVILGVLVCLKLLGIDLHALFLVASGLLIAISFGLRDLVNNFACGLMLLFERPIRVGDIVCVNDQEGRVTHIGSRAVTVRTWDHMEVIVPNTEIFNKSFINWTVKDDIVRTVIAIKIDRRDNPHEVQKVIHEVLKNNKHVLNNPVPEVFMKEMLDTTAEFEVRYHINVRQVESRVSVRSEVLYALWNAFHQYGIKAPKALHEILINDQQPLLPAPPL